MTAETDLAGFLAEAERQDQAATDKYDAAAAIPLAERKGAEYRALITGAHMHENAARYLREAIATEHAKDAIARVEAWRRDMVAGRPERVALDADDLQTVVEFARKAAGL